MSLLNNPRLAEKLRIFYKYVKKNDGKVGQLSTRGIDVNFNNACNLRCEVLFYTNSPKGDHVKEELSADYKAMADTS